MQLFSNAKKAKNKLIDARKNEILEYEFNARNYELMLAMVGDDAELQAFKEHLQGLLASTKLELRKAQIILQATMVNELELPRGE